MAVTRTQAETVLTAVKAKYAAHLNGANSEYGPKLIENWHWLSRPTEWAIVWEEGPFEWAYRFEPGGFDEELFNQILEFAGTTAAGRTRAREMAMEKPVELPDELWTEPVTAWALGVYER